MGARAEGNELFEPVKSGESFWRKKKFRCGSGGQSCLLRSMANEGLRGLGVITENTLFRCVNKTGSIWGRGITEKVVWCMVRVCASKAKLERLAPHDLRRTCARLCHEAGGELEQIQFLLGHVSVQTTERYLGCKQRLQDAVSDLQGFGGPGPVLTDVYYIVSQTNPGNKQVNNVLVKRGKELHEPDRMYLSPNQLLFVEPVGTNSKVAQLIAQAAH